MAYLLWKPFWPISPFRIALLFVLCRISYCCSLWKHTDRMDVWYNLTVNKFQYKSFIFAFFDVVCSHTFRAARHQPFAGSYADSIQIKIDEESWQSAFITIPLVLPLANTSSSATSAPTTPTAAAPAITLGEAVSGNHRKRCGVNASSIGPSNNGCEGIYIYIACRQEIDDASWAVT